MSPEFGSTIAVFPLDEETVKYLRLTGRSDDQLALVEAYAKEQGLWHDPTPSPGSPRSSSSTSAPSCRRWPAEASPRTGLAQRREGGVPLLAGRLRQRRRGG